MRQALGSKAGKNSLKLWLSNLWTLARIRNDLHHDPEHSRMYSYMRCAMIVSIQFFFGLTAQHVGS